MVCLLLTGPFNNTKRSALFQRLFFCKIFNQIQSCTSLITQKFLLYSLCTDSYHFVIIKLLSVNSFHVNLFHLVWFGDNCLYNLITLYLLILQKSNSLVQKLKLLDHWIMPSSELHVFLLHANHRVYVLFLLSTQLRVDMICLKAQFLDFSHASVEFYWLEAVCLLFFSSCG